MRREVVEWNLLCRMEEDQVRAAKVRECILRLPLDSCAASYGLNISEVVAIGGLCSG